VVQGGTVNRHHGHKPASNGSTLPFTGYDARAWGLSAILMVGIGAAFNFVGRRRSGRLSPIGNRTYPTATDRRRT
jgi:hypothetical protein